MLTEFEIVSLVRRKTRVTANSYVKEGCAIYLGKCGRCLGLQYVGNEVMG